MIIQDIDKDMVQILVGMMDNNCKKLTAKLHFCKAVHHLKKCIEEGGK